MDNKMEPIQQAITGNEKRVGMETPYESLVAFYDAFNNRDINLMEQKWANDDNIAMDNPLGGIMRGWKNIKPIYQRIFDGTAKVYVEFYDYTIHETPDMFYAVGRERGSFEANGEKITLAIRTSRIFKKLDGKWRQVHHHGTIESTALLKTYQELVKK